MEFQGVAAELRSAAAGQPPQAVVMRGAACCRTGPTCPCCAVTAGFCETRTVAFHQAGLQCMASPLLPPTLLRPPQA